MQGKLVVLGLVVYCLQALGAPSPEGKDGLKDRSSIPPGAESQPAIHVGKNSALAASTLLSAAATLACKQNYMFKCREHRVEVSGIHGSGDERRGRRSLILVTKLHTFRTSRTFALVKSVSAICANT
ncbi:hypothetical protein X797_007954 [Metarhizium robertsii]|uniref:Uncharacterized protein n=1 Tax=Metarhizium robertsii TaxID=568076 RepID=A0A0A1URV7_9HYPO|nr:hypothetical protein X797_007954 [Metarhizium robertsii]